jgi:hypothetical protein
MTYKQTSPSFMNSYPALVIEKQVLLSRGPLRFFSLVECRSSSSGRRLLSVLRHHTWQNEDVQVQADCVGRNACANIFISTTNLHMFNVLLRAWSFTPVRGLHRHRPPECKADL